VLPETVAAVDGGTGWEADGEQVPGELEAELPEQSVEEQAAVVGRPAARRYRGNMSEERSEEGELEVGEEGGHRKRMESGE